ncbi:hypothetical protein TIFTF001_018839 [Ficus carica]|uniref:Uncharacterized protein n=1 Tax=Ficus carica TaxID=3494 RepID=A0AA88AAJ1_FICCA|nr:hypothetical protein TIFTF001_018839 [Ficus carica]
MPRHRRGRAKAAKPAWLKQRGEFCRTQASVARTGPKGVAKQVCGCWVRPEAVKRVWDAGGHEMRVTIGTALDRDSGQIHSMHSAKTERTQQVGHVVNLPSSKSGRVHGPSGSTEGTPHGQALS